MAFASLLALYPACDSAVLPILPMHAKSNTISGCSSKKTFMDSPSSPFLTPQRCSTFKLSDLATASVASLDFSLENKGSFGSSIVTAKICSQSNLPYPEGSWPNPWHASEIRDSSCSHQCNKQSCTLCFCSCLWHRRTSPV